MTTPELTVVIQVEESTVHVVDLGPRVTLDVATTMILEVGTQGPAGPAGPAGAAGANSDSNLLYFSRINTDVVDFHRGMAVFSHSPVGARRSRATSAPTSILAGLCVNPITIGSSGLVCGGGVITLTNDEWLAVTGMVNGLAVGATYFLDVNPGFITPYPPTQSGQWVCSVGRAISSNALFIDLDLRIQI